MKTKVEKGKKSVTKARTTLKKVSPVKAPNEETIEAMEELEDGKGTIAESTEEFRKELDAPEVVVSPVSKAIAKELKLFPAMHILRKTCEYLVTDLEDEYYEQEESGLEEYCITNAHVGNHLYAQKFDPYVDPFADFFANDALVMVYVNVTVKKSFVNPDAIQMPNPMKVPHSVFLCFFPILFEREKGQTHTSFSTLRRLLLNKGIILVEGEDIQEIREKIEDKVMALMGE